MTFVLSQFAPKATPQFARAFATVFPRLAPAYGLTTPTIQAHFLGQMAHESAGFSRMQENLNYSAKRIPQVWPRLALRADVLAGKPEALANAAYGGRLGNGPEALGDGWRFRGQGPTMLTGRENYRRYGGMIGVDLEAHPELAAEPGVGMWIALAYWESTGCNEHAARDDYEEVTKAINGPAMLGLAERKALTIKAKELLVAGGLIA